MLAIFMSIVVVYLLQDFLGCSIFSMSDFNSLGDIRIWPH